MAQEERYGSRGFAYSAWHRRNSTRRYIGIEKAQLLSMIDVDAAVFVEYDDATKEPLALVEACQYVGQRFKTTTIITNLAKKAKIPAFLVMYELADCANPADDSCKDIVSFRVRRLYPDPTSTYTLSPQEYAEALLRIRTSQADLLDKADREDNHNIPF